MTLLDGDVYLETIALASVEGPLAEALAGAAVARGIAVQIVGARLACQVPPWNSAPPNSCSTNQASTAISMRINPVARGPRRHFGPPPKGVGASGNGRRSSQERNNCIQNRARAHQYSQRASTIAPIRQQAMAISFRDATALWCDHAAWR